MPGRLNLFQAVMLRWRDLHPYNAVHIVRLEQRLDPARLQDDINRQLEYLGLTGLVLDSGRRRFHFGGGPATVELKLLAGESDPLAVLWREVEAQLNAPFPREGRLVPFRFFAVDAGQSFRLGLVYDHFIAGGDSIVVLLKSIVELHTGRRIAEARARPPRLYPETYASLFLRYPGHALRALSHLPAMMAGCRRACRPRYADDRDQHVAFAYFGLDPAQTDALIRAAKRWGVTLNDLLLALLLRGLAPIAPQGRLSERRRELAVASIVNIRREFQPDANATFGQFLGSFRVSHRVPPGIGLQQLAQDVHAQTTRIKSEKLYFSTLLALCLNGLVWCLLSGDRRRRFYAKNYPLWAGITTLNVNALWENAVAGATRLEYMRAVPIGPIAPLVAAVTTVGEVVHLGVSYRTAAFDRETVDRIAADFFRCIDEL